MRLIDAEIPLEAIRHQMSKYKPDTAGYRFAQTILRYVEKAINKALTVDPVRHGHWVKLPTGEKIEPMCACSLCGRPAFGEINIVKQYKFYCDRCGAKMDGD